MRGRVGIISSSEVTIVRGDYGILLSLFDILPDVSVSVYVCVCVCVCVRERERNSITQQISTLDHTNSTVTKSTKKKVSFLPTCTYMYMYLHVHVLLMSDIKNKRKATPHYGVW